jgi:drug/metabolite transporter (DMT)-like permease
LIALLGGLGAAAFWAATTLTASRATRLIDPRSVLAWVMLVGFVIAAPLTAAHGVPSGLGARELGWLAVAGAGNVGGLLLGYSALRVGKVSIIAPITSTEGAIAALLALVAGESVGLGSGVMLVVIACGVVLASIAPVDGPDGHPLRATLLAAAAAVFFGAGLYATGRVSQSLPLVWALIPPRAVGVVAVALPLIATRRLRITRKALPLVVASGLAELGGFTAFAIGARHGIAIAAVLASQFAALAAIAAFLLFRERITRTQVTGVAVIAVGVAVLSALRA